MTLRDFKIGWRLLTSQPAYSAVVIFGLSIGFAACFLLLGFVHYSFHYNAAVPDVDDVYVVKQRFNIDPAAPWFDQVPYLLRNAALASPDVAAVTGYDPNGLTTVRIGTQLHKLKNTIVLPGFARMLGVQVSEGDLQTALEQPDSFAVTQQMAQQLFGTPHALGKTMVADGKALRVGAIMRNPSANSTITFDAIMGTNTVLLNTQTRNTMLAGDGSGWGKLIVRVRPGASLSALTALLQQAIDESPLVQTNSAELKQRLGNRKVMEIQLAPLRDAYFDHDIASNQITLPGERGDPMLVGGLAAVAMLILALAAINYVNLATVRILQRQREIGMRKTIGATARSLIAQFLGESLLSALLATALGLLLAWLALPLFSELMNRKLDSEFTLSHVAFALLLGALVGLLTALYPAWIALRVRPMQVLLGRANSESLGGRQLRRAMTVVQIAVALGLTSVTAAIAWQTSYAMRAAPGFDPAPVLIVDLPENVKGSARANGFIATLSQQSGIVGISLLSDAVGRSKNRFGVEMSREGNASAFLELKTVSVNFFDEYQLKPVAGRLFDPHIDQEDDSDTIVLNEEAIRALGYASPQAALGQILSTTTSDGQRLQRRIIGIAPALRFFSLREAPRATAWELSTGDSILSVRSDGSVAAAEQEVLKIWPQYFPDAMPELQSADEILSANYADDARITRLLIFSSAIALAIAAFGIYALSAYTVQRRSREIVLRKLLGAGQGDIAWLLLREIGLLILISAALGLPCAAIVIQRYLAAFVEHAAIGYWTLLLALLATLVIALAALARHILITMRMMPALVLKN